LLCTTPSSNPPSTLTAVLEQVGVKAASMGEGKVRLRLCTGADMFCMRADSKIEEVRQGYDPCSRSSDVVQPGVSGGDAALDKLRTFSIKFDKF
jgi:hypothetical protein